MASTLVPLMEKMGVEICLKLDVFSNEFCACERNSVCLIIGNTKNAVDLSLSEK